MKLNWSFTLRINKSHFSLVGNVYISIIKNNNKELSHFEPFGWAQDRLRENLMNSDGLEELTLAFKSWHAKTQIPPVGRNDT